MQGHTGATSPVVNVPGPCDSFYVFWMIQSAQWFLLSAVHAVVKYST